MACELMGSLFPYELDPLFAADYCFILSAHTSSAHPPFRWDVFYASLEQMVSVMRAATTYGSAFALGRRSSM